MAIECEKMASNVKKVLQEPDIEAGLETQEVKRPSLSMGTMKCLIRK